MEESRRYAAFAVHEKGQTAYFAKESAVQLFDVAVMLRNYERGELIGNPSSFRESYSGAAAITAQEYAEYAVRIGRRDAKVSGVFNIDLDRGRLSTMDQDGEWHTYATKNISTAVYHAHRKKYIPLNDVWRRFREALQELPKHKQPAKLLNGSRRLCPADISFEDEMIEMDDLHLNFYMPTRFNVDDVFGTNVCTDENDDCLNIYADYDMKRGVVYDMLSIALWHGDDCEEYEFPLTDEEKAMILPKMNEFCKQQTGMGLAEYSAARLTEEQKAIRPQKTGQKKKNAKKRCEER